MPDQETGSPPLGYFATIAYFPHLGTHMCVSIYTCTHTYSVVEGEGVPWPFAVLVFDIWGADVDLCVSVATADGNIRALPWLSEIPSFSFPSLFSPAVSGSVYSLRLTLSNCVSQPGWMSLPHSCLQSAGLQSLGKTACLCLCKFADFWLRKRVFACFSHRYSSKII